MYRFRLESYNIGYRPNTNFMYKFAYLANLSLLIIQVVKDYSGRYKSERFISVQVVKKIKISHIW